MGSLALEAREALRGDVAAAYHDPYPFTRTGAVRWRGAYFGRVIRGYLGVTGSTVFSVGMTVFEIPVLLACYIGFAVTVGATTGTSALLWVVQMMGGRSTSLPEPRTFTPIELALVRHLMDDTFEHLNAGLDGLLPAEPRFSSVHYNPQYLQVISGAAPVIVAGAPWSW